MRTILVLFCVLTLGASSFSADVDYDPWKKLPEFGAKSDSTITVRISGDGIEKAGTYHLPRGTPLLALLKQASQSRYAFQFTVTRTVEGYHRSFGFRWAHAKQPPLPAFVLEHGDYVVAMERRDP